MEEHIDYHKVAHSFKPTIIVPYVAIENNLHFFCQDKDRFVKTNDDVIAKVLSCKEKHICELDNEIMRLYNISAWDFLMRWYGYKPFGSAMFVVMDLKQQI